MTDNTGPRSEANMRDLPFDPSTLEDEAESGGWIKTTRPEGSSDLITLMTAGTRGAENDHYRSVPHPG